MPGAGDLRERLRFQRRGVDANGDRLGAWEGVFTCWAQLVWLRGGESVQQQRLEGRQPVAIVIRESSDSRAVDSSWRAVDARDESRVFSLNSVAPHRERGFLDILGTMGGATG